MKKIILFVTPFFLAIIIFIGITFFLGANSGNGALQVTSTPRATVYLDGRKIGNTPLCKCELQDLIKTGDYTIKLITVGGGFNAFEEKIAINKSTLTVVDREFASGASSSGSVITLSPLSNKKDAELLVVSIPNEANVVLDNNAIGTTPYHLKNLTESDHNLNLTKDGYKNKSVNIRTALGFKLIALVSLGVNPIEASASAAQLASSSAILAVKKVLILDTPTGFLRVRAASSTASLEVSRVSPGETFELISEGNGWFEIKLKDGKTGWVSSQYAKKE